VADHLAKEVAYWITERESIRRQREYGAGPPWTSDDILRKYRFCNVRREDDAVTRWIAKFWRNPNVDDPYLPRAITLARMVNWPPTLKAMGYPKPYNAEHIVSVIHQQERKGKAWSSAYIVSTNGKPINKAVYIAQVVSKGVPPWPTLAKAGNSLQAVHTRLMECHGLGSFLAAQVVADLKNTPGHPLQKAPDWKTWAAEGPGSKRGLRRYFGVKGMPTNGFLPNLWIMADEVRPRLPRYLRDICMQDWQNVMCEFDKYRRAKLGPGRPKARYSPNPDF